MVEKEIKRHHIFLIVFGIILGFADPITDILCFVFLLTYYVLKKSELKKVSIARRCRQVILCAANPFFPAFLKLQTLFFLPEEFYEFLAWQ